MAASLLVNSDDGVVRLTLNRPEKRNALSVELLGELERAIGSIAADRTTRVVIVAAAGPVFCSGHDLGEMVGRSEGEYRSLFELCSRVMLGLRKMPQPVIARVQGVATAAGCQLVAACDLAVAANEAMFATPGVKIGLFCTTPMVPLVRTIPPRAAMEMLLTGAPITAARAVELGLVNRAVAADQLDAVIQSFADTIIAQSSFVIGIGKKAFYNLGPLDEASAYRQAVSIMTENAVCHDAQEGIAAFLGKRPANWSGS